MADYEFTRRAALVQALPAAALSTYGALSSALKSGDTNEAMTAVAKIQRHTDELFRLVGDEIGDGRLTIIINEHTPGDAPVVVAHAGGRHWSLQAGQVL